MHSLGALDARRLGAMVCMAALVLTAGCSTADVQGTLGPTTEVSAARQSVQPGASLNGVRVVSTLPTADASSGYKIASDDLLEVDVFQVDQLDRTVRVGEDGRITLPLIGEVTAAGRSARDLELELQSLYGAKYLQSPQISVFVKESVGQRVAVDGAVKQPGIKSVTASSSLVGMIAEAGGLTQIADRSKVYVFRKVGDERLVAQYDLQAIRTGKAGDPRIQGGDVVYVFDSSTRVAMRNLREALGVVTSAAGIL